MKKVLIVASVISFIEWFNRENLLYLKNGLDCDVHVACNMQYMEDTDVDRTVRFIDDMKKSGIVFHDIHFDRSPFGRGNLKAYKTLKHLVDDGRFDLIHCHTPAASVLTRLAARKARKRGAVIMYTCHGFHFHRAAPRKNWILYYPIERLLSRFCDYLVTINAEDYQRAASFHSCQVRYIPGVGVDLRRFQVAEIDRKAYRDALGIPEEAILILSLGELIERKNHEVIIRAIAQLKRPDLHYAICGKGPLKDYLTALSQELGIGEQVHLLGFRTDVPEICHAADIGAFPSKIEGLGLAGIEMMASGLPLVASNVHGILDYVKDGVTGFACPPDDAGAFADVIEKLTEQPNTADRMKDACRKAVEPFDLQNALNEMWKIYREALCVKNEANIYIS